MANEQLTAFLAEGTPPAAEPPQEAPAPDPAPTPAPEPAPAPAPPKPEDDDAEPPAAIEGEAVVPHRAYENERRRRQDWKEKASRFEGENAELRRQLEEAKKAPPPVAQPAAQTTPQFTPLPDPAQDPAGFATAFAMRQQQMLVNERLNWSEQMLRREIGTEKLDAYVADFKEMMAADPSLSGKLYAQVHPYEWLSKEVDAHRMRREIGDNPGAYRERIEAEARAKWEAELATRAAPVPQPSPMPQMAPSLATARSVAGRTAPAWTGEPTLDEVLAPVINRKRRQA